MRCAHAALAMLTWLVAPGACAAVFDFSAQYPVGSATFASGVVSMSVFDEERNMTKATNIASGTTFDLLAVNGVVVWSSASQIYYFTYDPTLGRWVGETGVLGPTANDLRTTNGIVTWSTTAGAIYYRVYDRNRAAWRAGSAATLATSNLRTVDGTVAWSTGGGAYARVYDPIKGTWQAKDAASVSTADLMNTNGVVAFSGSGIVSFHVYDPARGAWQSSNVASAATFDLRNANGVVAWSTNPAVSYAVYDPARGRWMGGSVPASGYTADLAIVNSVVSWTTPTSYAKGYDPITGAWGNNPAVRLAYFAVSTNSANAPLLVSFIDMSIGGLSWSWNFGDGTTSAARSPTHLYTNFGGFVAVQTVSGSFGTAATNKLIVTDVTPPSGTVVINSGAALTTNSAVTLTLAATDNSGRVALMHFSNTNGAAWSAWEPYATSKTWTLSAGDGTKTAYAQFADVVTNVSATATDIIQLDTSPLLVVSVLSTNVPEAAGLATVRVVLSTNFTRLVSINYATSNGTAAAGADYTSAAGRLDFPPGVTVQTFNVTILPDGLVELNETIQIILSNPTNCIPGAPGVVTILDDDLPAVSFASTNFSVLESASNAVVTVQLTAPSGLTVVVGYLATNGTALAGLDFVATNGLLTIPSGQTNASFLVRILDDMLDELTETIALRLTTVTNAILAAPTNATLAILDDDAPLIGFSRKLYSVFENDFFILINVWLSKPVTMDVAFDYEVLGGTATPGSDYIPQSARRTITAGSTNVSLIVNLVDNAVPEPDETVHLALSNISGAAPGPNAEADILVYDDDRPPRLLAPRRGTNGLFQATAFGPTGQVFTVQTSSNLSVWASAFSLTNVTGTFDFSDPGSLSESNRFYRTSQP